MTLLLQKDYVPLKPLMMVNISFAVKYFLIKVYIMLFKYSFLNIVFWFLFGCAGSSLPRAFLKLQRAGLTVQLQHPGFSLHRVLLLQNKSMAPGLAGFSSWHTWAQ